MSINSSIIFTVGSKLGPGGFASLKAGIDMLVALGRQIVDITSGLDDFSLAWDRTNKQAIVMADNATKGLIDAADLVNSYNALVRSGAKVTEEQFRIMAVRSVELAKATGVDATEAFKRMTRAIQTGATESLREYGIQLNEGDKFTKRQTDAIKQMTAGFEDMTVAAETGTERLKALGENIETTAGLIWSSAGSSDTFAFALDEVNEALGTFNTLLGQAPESMMEFIKSGQALKGFMAELEIQMLELVNAPFIAIERSTNEPGLMSTMMRVIFGGEGKTGGAGFLEQKIDDAKKRLAGASSEILELLRTQASKEILETEPFVAPPGVRRRDDGGERELHDPGQGFLEKDIAEAKILQDFINEQHTARVESLQARQAAEAEAEQMALFESLDRQEIYFAELDRLEEESYSRSLSNLEMFFGVEQEALAQSNKQWQSGLQGKANMAATFFGAIAQLQNTESEKLFNIGKAGAIAEGLINTYLGAIKAYQSFAGLGPWGIALGAVAAAAVTAAGLANVARIRAQKFKGGESGGSVAAPTISGGSAKSIGGLSGASGAPPGVGPGAGSPGGPLKQEITVNIKMQDDAGSAMFEVMMDENDRADRDGRRSLTPMGRAA
jgi:hypothetical protein